MSSSTTIAVDGMGGDSGPVVIVPGMAVALERQPDLKFLLFGDEKQITPVLDQHAKLKAATTVHHTDIAISSDEKPSAALRRGRHGASMWLAIQAVKSGQASVIVSAGNTGALMVMAKIVLRSMPGVPRPAMAAIWPTTRGQSIVLDVGANIGAVASHLVGFAVMGEAMARSVFGLKRPTVGLLNVGVEEVKGLEEVREAGRLIRDSDLPLEYGGFVEGTDIGKGTVDVVVTEGFTGNIALKTAEGTANQFGAFLKQALNSTLMSKIGYFFARGAFQAVREKLDPNNNNGAVLLGLNGIVVKSHGAANVAGFASAVSLASHMASNRLIERIAADIEKIGLINKEDKK
ncbi:Phosphate:acyl-ACP acyltransferase PlsX (EC 2.3.1.n2) [hydrothermal vent metagenome]|uniref:phosphate acyltransferase n=1 Tax=hydrothermal vent metagenome TaxID=652676 RepID=A0A3B0RDY8_9ZZZZ